MNTMSRVADALCREDVDTTWQIEDIVDGELACAIGLRVDDAEDGAALVDVDDFAVDHFEVDVAGLQRSGEHVQVAADVLRCSGIHDECS